MNYRKMETIHPLIKCLIEERKKQHLTRYALSQKTHLSQSLLARTERGETSPTLTTLSAYAEALNLTIKVEPSNQS